jgi:hypothetical protein
LPELTREFFAARCGQVFSLALGDGRSLDFELVRLREGRSSPQQEVWAVEFRGPCDLYLPQGTYALAQPAAGMFELFLVPVDQDSHGYYYESVFNRLLPHGG